MSATPPNVLAISSMVARGSVGNRASIFAFESLGIRCSAVPTIYLSWHPGHGPATRYVPKTECFRRMIADLTDADRTRLPNAIMTGYFASAEQVEIAAGFIRSVKAARPEITYLCDPVMGDGEALYVDRSIASAIRNSLLPICDILTPNAFELSWLSGQPQPESSASALSMAKKLAIDRVLVSSLPGSDAKKIGNLLLGAGKAHLLEHQADDRVPKGTGDLMASLFLGRLLLGDGAVKAMESAIASTLEIIGQSIACSSDELCLSGNQQSILFPKVVSAAVPVGPKA